MLVRDKKFILLVQETFCFLHKVSRFSLGNSLLFNYCVRFSYAALLPPAFLLLKGQYKCKNLIKWTLFKILNVFLTYVTVLVPITRGHTGLLQYPPSSLTNCLSLKAVIIYKIWRKKRNRAFIAADHNSLFIASPTSLYVLCTDVNFTTSLESSLFSCNIQTVIFSSLIILSLVYIS